MQTGPNLPGKTMTRQPTTSVPHYDYLPRRWRFDGERAALVLAGWLMFCAADARAGATEIVRPFETQGGSDWSGPVDAPVLAALKKSGIAPANLCSDEVFIRRAYLDTTGTLPDAGEVRSFLEDRRPTKRAQLIDDLLGRDAFADYQAVKWCDLLRVKSEFPINLWPNAVQAYHRWIRDSIRSNKPYDVFVRELLTSSGSNFRVPPVNFYRAIQGREPATIAEAAALTFMGTRIESWPTDRREGMAKFFSRVAYKSTAEWKEEIVLLNPAPSEPFTAVLPDGTSVRITPDQDPRQVFAKWLITPENPWFARNIVNRQWSWLLGRGIIHEPDDIRPDNPPSNPDLLRGLEKEFIRNKYDLKAMYRLILNSRTYQQSSIPQSKDVQGEKLFASYAVRRLEAEVLIDVIDDIFGSHESYISAVPEPFSIIPEHERTIDLADGSISSGFLEMFGRPARDTGLESERNNRPTDAQCMHLLNSSHIQRKIESSWKVRQWVNTSRKSPAGMIRMAYMTILSRPPTGAELAAAEDYVRAAGKRPDQGMNDLIWALINSKEFLYRH